MIFSFVQGVWVGVHTAENPLTEEWTRHCKRIEEVRHRTRAVVVYTDGGGPSARQRKEMSTALREVAAPPTAIMTRSAVVRGIITSCNWLFGSQQVAPFAPHDLDGVMRYLSKSGVPLVRDEIVRTLVAHANALSVVLELKLSPRLADSLRP